jgi:hypothetical protein
MFSKDELKELSHKLEEEESGNVKVMCRFRPLNENELSRGGKDISCEFHQNKKSVTIQLSKKAGEAFVGTNKFTFDRVFDLDATQREV